MLSAPIVNAPHIMKVLAKVSVEQFKEMNSSASIQVVRSPKTEKLFMSDELGNTLGAVSTKWVADKESAVMQIETEIGDEVWILFNPVASENVVATL